MSRLQNNSFQGDFGYEIKFGDKNNVDLWVNYWYFHKRPRSMCTEAGVSTENCGYTVPFCEVVEKNAKTSVTLCGSYPTHITLRSRWAVLQLSFDKNGLLKFSLPKYLTFVLCNNDLESLEAISDSDYLKLDHFSVVKPPAVQQTTRSRDRKCNRIQWRESEMAAIVIVLPTVRSASEIRNTPKCRTIAVRVLIK